MTHTVQTAARGLTRVLQSSSPGDGARLGIVTGHLTIVRPHVGCRRLQLVKTSGLSGDASTVAGVEEVDMFDVDGQLDGVARGDIGSRIAAGDEAATPGRLVEG